MNSISNLENNKRIAKNTLVLYARMMLIMAVTLYTSRIILKVLGIEDFGIYNVVGGIVTILGFLNSSLSGATSRFITFEIGKGKAGDVNRIFRCAVSAHYLFSLLILLLGETIGLWFVLEKMVIPQERMFAALWVYQCSIFTILITIITSPYNALIIAYERMNIFAYISVFESIAKLLIVFFLANIKSYDKLILYAILLLLIQLIIRLFYSIYCLKYFLGINASYLWDKKMFKEIFVYTGWTLNGYLAVIGYTQGLNILLNLFFGPIVNAARGIAVNVESAVNQFFSNFQMAVRPQIIKSYAQGDLKYMHKLILSSSKYSFYLMLLISVPIIIYTDYILYLWLGQVPEHSVIFVRLILLICMNATLKNPTLIAIHATGNIKKFQLIESTLLLTIVPIAYIFLSYTNMPPESVFIVYLVIEIITQFVRVWIVYPCVNLSRKLYLKEVLFPIFQVLILLSIIIYFLMRNNIIDSFFMFCGNVLLCIVSTAVIIYFIGLKKQERNYIFKNIISNRRF